MCVAGTPEAEEKQICSASRQAASTVERTESKREKEKGGMETKKEASLPI